VKVSKTRKIQICIFNHFGYSLYNNQSKVLFGGSEIQLYLLSKAFAEKENFEVHVITGDYDLKKKVNNYDKIYIHVSLPIRGHLINYLKGFINLSSILMKIKPDVIIQRASGIPTFFFALYCRFFKKRFIYSIASQKDVIKGGKAGISHKLYKYGLNNASYIVAQNEDQISYLESWRNKSIRNIKVIKNAFEIREVDVKDKKTILWVGRSVTEKRPELFLKLAEYFPNKKFVFICNKFYHPKSWNYWNNLHKRALQLPNVEFLEFVPFNEIDYYFKNAKVFVNTSLHEGFPNTFIQALIHKTPIISLNVDPDNFLTKYKCGINCNNDFTKMIEQLRALIEDQDLYDSFSNNTFNYVKKNHDISKISNEWILLIEKLMNI